MSALPFERLHKAVAYVYAGLGFGALALGPELSGPMAAAVVVAFVASWFAEGPAIARPSYARFWNVAVLGVFALQVVRALGGAPLLTLGVEYAAFLQVSRLFHRRSAREYQHVAVLAFLHLIAATVLTTDLHYAFVFLGFVIVTPWMLALTHMRAHIEEADAQPALRARDLAGGRFLLGTALLAVPLFVVTVALFLLFPRVGMGFLSFRTDQAQPVAGFGRNVVLGGFGVIRHDPTVILRVRVPDAGDPPPEQLALRMRGTSFDRYDGRSWTRTPTRGAPLPRMWRDHYALHRWPQAGDRVLSVVLDPLDEPVVFLPEGTVALSVPPRVRAGRDVSRRLVRSLGTDVRYTDGDGLRLLYDAHVSPHPNERREPLDHETRALFLQLPPDHERTVALARDIVGDAGTDAERARRILRYLRDSGRYDYSLQQPEVGDSPAESFLFEARTGHCEYFSTAMALLLRAVDVPARNVTGFVGGRYNAFGDYYAIRQGDAHSWVEAYVNGVWMSYDPTPAGRDSVGPRDDDVLASLRALVDAIHIRWATHVVGYDLRDQALAFRRLRHWLAGGSRVEQGGEGGRPWERSGDGGWGAPPWWLAVGAVVLGLLALAWRWHRRRAAARTEDVAVGLYRRLDRALAKAGRPRPPGTTPAAHACRLAEEGFPAADAVGEVTHAYLAARFGGRALEAAEHRRLTGRVREVRLGAPLVRKHAAEPGGGAGASK
jgi:protein-glutamine gamma-glutamyltransferase